MAFTVNPPNSVNNEIDKQLLVRWTIEFFALFVGFYLIIKQGEAAASLLAASVIMTGTILFEMIRRSGNKFIINIHDSGLQHYTLLYVDKKYIKEYNILVRPTHFKVSNHVTPTCSLPQ